MSFNPEKFDQSLIDLLVSGGDSRLTITSQGCNKYGCTPYPRDVVPFGSCTASTISPRGWEAAKTGKIKIESMRDKVSLTGIAESMCAHIRQQLVQFLGMKDTPNSEVVLTPSGTDAEMVALALAGQTCDQKLVNIIVGPNEVGSGTVMAAGARHFDTITPSGAKSVVGDSINDAFASRVTVKTVYLRTSNGEERSPKDLDEEVSRLIEDAVGKKARVIVHVVAHSKTGVHAPTLKTINELANLYGDQLVGVIDAAQGRISRRGLKEYLSRDYMILFTGSKFYGGPPFSGALLVPEKYCPSGSDTFGFPEGFGDYFTAAEFPEAWKGIRNSLPNTANLGLILRWTAALEEIQAYYEASSAGRLKILRYFESEAPRILASCPVVSLLPVHPPLLDDEAERVLESKRSVISMRIIPSGQKNSLSRNALKQWVNLLNVDLSQIIHKGHSLSVQKTAKRLFHIGQAVFLGPDDGGNNSCVIRVAIGGGLITDLATNSAMGRSLDDRLEWLNFQLHTLSNKLMLIDSHQDELIKN